MIYQDIDPVDVSEPILKNFLRDDLVNCPVGQGFYKEYKTSTGGKLSSRDEEHQIIIDKNGRVIDCHKVKSAHLMVRLFRTLNMPYLVTSYQLLIFYAHEHYEIRYFRNEKDIAERDFQKLHGYLSKTI